MSRILHFPHFIRVFNPCYLNSSWFVNHCQSLLLIILAVITLLHSSKMNEQQYLHIKYLSITTKGSKWQHMSVCERERERERETDRQTDRETEIEDCYDCHHLGHIRELVRDCKGLHYIFRFTPYLRNPCWDTYFRNFLLCAFQHSSSPPHTHTG